LIAKPDRSECGRGEALCRSCAKLIRAEIDCLLADAASWLGSPTPVDRRLIRDVVPRIAEDLHALVSGDPAARRSCLYVLRSYASFRAVLAYRVAHALLAREPAAGDRCDRWALARCLSERAKVASGIEIHPAAVIGRRFVIDHGLGTVIGETAEIGDDCYILQGVILGSRGISRNPDGKRHPTLGSRVEIGAFARLLGPVQVGDGALIGPHCVVTSDVPAGARVTIRNQCQIASAHNTGEVFGLVPGISAGSFAIHGRGLAEAEVIVVQNDLTPVRGAVISVSDASDRRLLCRISAPAGSSPVPSDAGLTLRFPGGLMITLLRCGVAEHLAQGPAPVSVAG
jgi:serine O-acetyltransferase